MTVGGRMTFAGEAFAFDGLVLTPVGQSPSWDPEPAPGSTRGETPLLRRLPAQERRNVQFPTIQRR